MLRFLNEAFTSINMRVSELAATNNFQGLADKLGRGLETIDRLYTQWKALPNWPISLAMILKFVATVVIPAVGYFLVQRLLGKSTSCGEVSSPQMEVPCPPRKVICSTWMASWCERPHADPRGGGLSATLTTDTPFLVLTNNPVHTQKTSMSARG